MNLSKALTEHPDAYSSDDVHAIKSALRFVRALSDNGRDIDIAHLLNVASTLVEEKADSRTVVIALLHHVLEDGACSYDHLVENFGERIAGAVESLTMISDLTPPDTIEHLSRLKDREDGSAYRLRVLGVKIACRLDRMRKVEELSQEKQISIARETRDVYVDLAVLMGMYGIADEMDKCSKDIFGMET